MKVTESLATCVSRTVGGMRRWKWLLMVLCVLAAGTGYRLSRETADEEGRGQRMLLSEQTERDVLIREEMADPESGQLETADLSVLEMEALVSETSKAVCCIHICGEVKDPGVYQLEEGSRLYQAVEAAGGFSEEAAKDYLNMAQTVSDGMKIVVPRAEDLVGLEAYGLEDVFLQGGGQSQSGNAGSDSGKVNLNTATKEELMTLSGIGESRAEDIIRYRTDYGPFETIEEVMQVSGIKDAAFAKIRDDITV